MQIRLYVLLTTLLAAAGTTHAATITEQELNQTLIDASNAVQERQYDHAFALYQKAAKWGDKYAQFVVGNMYHLGTGTEQDNVAAYAWLKTASEARVREYRQALKDAEQALSASQMTRAEQLAENLIENYGMKAAGVICKKAARIGTNIRKMQCTHNNRTGSGKIRVPDGS